MKWLAKRRLAHRKREVSDRQRDLYGPGFPQGSPTCAHEFLTTTEASGLQVVEPCHKCGRSAVLHYQEGNR